MQDQNNNIQNNNSQDNNISNKNLNNDNNIHSNKSKNNIFRNVLIALAIVFLFSMLFGEKDKNSVNQPQNQQPQTKPAPQTEYAIGQPYEKDVFTFTLANPRTMDSTLGNDKYLVLDAEAVAKKDTPLGITISGITNDGEIINSDIAPMVKDYKHFPLFENMQSGQKIKGQIGFKITDGKEIKKITVQEAGKFITYNL